MADKSATGAARPDPRNRPRRSAEAGPPVRRPGPAPGLARRSTRACRPSSLPIRTTELADVAASIVARAKTSRRSSRGSKASPPDSLVLDLLIRVREDEEVWAAVASHPNVSNETLRVLARNATPIVQDIIITNQMRLFSCLEILDDLRANPQVNQVVLRRVREFEEEFIQKVLAEEEEALAVAGRSIEEAIDALHAIGAHIPNEDDDALSGIRGSGAGGRHQQGGASIGPRPPPQNERPRENRLRLEGFEGGAGNPHQQPQSPDSTFGARQPQAHRS